MLYQVLSRFRAARWFFLCFLFVSICGHAQTTNVRIMAANLNGNSQTYQPTALRIFQGLKPDVVAIQEFNYNNNTPADFRSMVDTAFGTNFVYFREANGFSIPNGIISRYPILNSGSWADAEQSQPNRGFAWAQIDVPGSNDLYIVSVHLLTSSATARGNEATALKSLIQANFPAGAWIVVAGDFNCDTRTEAAITTLTTFLSDNPIPADNNGNSFTSQNRNHPHDYVLPSFSLTNIETASVFPSHTFANGLVFDSTVYTPLTDVAPVQFGDSTNAQHMGVIKDFLVSGTDSSDTNAPSISLQPQDLTVPAGSNATFSVTATGAAPLYYLWGFNNTLFPGSTVNTIALLNAQPGQSGRTYWVIVTNANGSVTSSVATLTVTNAAPTITTQPQIQIVRLGGNPTFSVAATGTAPLTYQWFFNTNTLIDGAITDSFTITNAQLNNAGTYSIVVSNSAGSVTSVPVNLIISSPSTTTNIIAQWNFNSVSPDGVTTTGSTSPSVGSGTAALFGGTTATFAGGDASLDPAASDNSGWNTASYPAANTGNKTRGVQFNVSTAGKQHIAVTWSSQSSNTGSKYGRLQYSTNGTDFIDFSLAFTNGTSFTAKTNNLETIPGVNDNPNFAIRFVSEFESSALNDANTNYAAATTYAGTGTMRYDMVTVLGSDIPPIILIPPPPVLAFAGITNNQFQFTVTGASGSNYVVQVSTNLNASNWISLFTNTAPFTFIDSNAPAFPQSFYRAVSQP